MSERARVIDLTGLIVIAAWAVLGTAVLEALAAATLARDVGAGFATFFSGVQDGAYWFAIVLAIACALVLVQAIGLPRTEPVKEPDEGGQRGKRGRRRPARG